MKKFDYTVRNKTGFHSRHAGQLAIRAKVFNDTVITVSANGNSAEPTRVMRLMGLGITQGCNVTVTAEGSRENEAISEFYRFFEYYL